MEKKWTFCVVNAIIYIQSVRGVWEEFKAREDIYAVPGSDVSLTCQTQKTILVQVQWSKVTKKMALIALYHPLYGLLNAHGNPRDLLVTFSETGNVTKWNLLLRNVSSSFSGKYECSFTLYPEGVRTKIYNLFVQTSATQDEWRGNHTIETEINQTLKIPCSQNISSETSPKLTFTWLVDNGTQETVIIQHHIVNSATSLKDRVKLGTDHGLVLSPVHTQDDGRMFSCLVRVRPGKILRSATTVKVFAKPEILVTVENNTMDVSGERIFTCLLKNVFPKANLTWLIDGRLLQGEEEGIYITNEERKGKDGFLELKSVLTRMHGNTSAQPNNLTIWCMALSPGPGNKLWNISSEKITFSLGSTSTPTAPTFSVTESTTETPPSAAYNISSARYPATSSVALKEVGASTPQATLQTSNSSVTAQGFNYSSSTSGEDAKTSISWTFSEPYSSSPSGAGSTSHDHVFSNTSREFSEVLTTANGSTKNNHIRITSVIANQPKDGMPWPVIVAALLCFCMLLFGLGVRKWCQYQKGIMERPPPFKPPPPPMKYTCIQEPIGGDLPCHEMETL